MDEIDHRVVIPDDAEFDDISTFGSEDLELIVQNVDEPADDNNGALDDRIENPVVAQEAVLLEDQEHVEQPQMNRMDENVPLAEDIPQMANGAETLEEMVNPHVNPDENQMTIDDIVPQENPAEEPRNEVEMQRNEEQPPAVEEGGNIDGVEEQREQEQPLVGQERANNGEEEEQRQEEEMEVDILGEDDEDEMNWMMIRDVADLHQQEAQAVPLPAELQIMNEERIQENGQNHQNLFHLEDDIPRENPGQLAEAEQPPRHVHFNNQVQMILPRPDDALPENNEEERQVDLQRVGFVAQEEGFENQRDPFEEGNPMVEEQPQGILINEQVEIIRYGHLREDGEVPPQNDVEDRGNEHHPRVRFDDVVEIHEIEPLRDEAQGNQEQDDDIQIIEHRQQANEDDDDVVVIRGPGPPEEGPELILEAGYNDNDFRIQAAAFLAERRRVLERHMRQQQRAQNNGNANGNEMLEMLFFPMEGGQNEEGARIPEAMDFERFFDGMIAPPPAPIQNANDDDVVIIPAGNNAQNNVEWQINDAVEMVRELNERDFPNRMEDDLIQPPPPPPPQQRLPPLPQQMPPPPPQQMLPQPPLLPQRFHLPAFHLPLPPPIPGPFFFQPQQPVDTLAPRMSRNNEEAERVAEQVHDMAPNLNRAWVLARTGYGMEFLVNYVLENYERIPKENVVAPNVVRERPRDELLTYHPDPNPQAEELVLNNVLAVAPEINRQWIRDHSGHGTQFLVNFIFENIDRIPTEPRTSRENNTVVRAESPVSDDEQMSVVDINEENELRLAKRDALIVYIKQHNQPAEKLKAQTREFLKRQYPMARCDTIVALKKLRNNFERLAVCELIALQMLTNDVLRELSMEFLMDEISSDVPWLEQTGHIKRRKGLGILPAPQNIKEAIQEVSNVLKNASPDSTTCDVCFSDVIKKKALSCTESTEKTVHSLCLECLREHAKALCTDGRLAEGGQGFLCVYPECENVLPWAVVKRHLDRKTRKILGKRIDNEAVLALEGLESCKYCSYQMEILASTEELRVFSCKKCKAEFCRLCKEDWKEHIGRRCEEMKKHLTDKEAARKRIEEELANAVMRQCHRCGVRFSKTEGCNKMTCRCGAKQCYVCRKGDIDYSHFCRHAREPGQKRCPENCENPCTLWETVDQDNVNQVRERARMDRNLRDVIGDL